MVISTAAAVCARTTGRAVRVFLDRDDDMLITGGRHPFLFKYKVGFKASGKIMALDVKMYNNGGCSTDLSPHVLEKSMFALDGAYFIPNARLMGWSCRTNIPSNTSFRAFGTPQV